MQPSESFMRVKKRCFLISFRSLQAANFFITIIFIFFAVNGVSSPLKGGSIFQPSGAITLNITVINVTSDVYIAPGFLHNGSITIQPNGGVAPYQYTITINNVTGTYNLGYFPTLDPGNYAITVTDAAGQRIDTSVNITYVFPQPLVEVSNVVYQNDCDSTNGSFTLTASGGTPPYSFSIDGGATFTTNGNFNGLPQALYYVIAKDAKGQMAEVDTNVTQTAQRGLINLICQTCNCIGGIYTVQSSACSNQWPLWVDAYATFPRMSFSLDGINYKDLPLLPVYPYTVYRYDTTLTGPGVYKVYIKDKITGNITIWGIAMPKYCYIAITTVNVNASCRQSNGSITVTAANGTPPYLYTMDGINYQSSNVFTGLSSGGYYVTVKDASGNTSSEGTYVSDNCPVISATTIDDTCNQKKGSIIATGQYGTTPYQYSIDGVNFHSSGVFTGLIAGTYKVILKDAGGYTDTTTIMVKNNCIQISAVVTNTTCSNKNGSISISAANATSPYKYSIDGINFQANSVFDSLFAGTYTVTVMDVNGILNYTTVTITDSPAPKLNVTTTQAGCDGKNGAINITTTGGTTPLQFSIDNGNIYQSANTFSNVDSGQYFIIVHDANICTAMDTVTVTAPPTPDVFIGNDTTLCNGQTLILQTPFVANYHYLWQDNSMANQYLVRAPGNYFVKVTNQFNCSASDTIKIKYYGTLAFTLGSDTSVCDGNTLILQPKPSLQGSYLWSDGSTNAHLNIQSGGIYWLEVSDSGCAATDTIIIKYKPDPVVSLGNDTTLCEAQILTLNASNLNSTYLWQDGSTQPRFVVNSAGTYSVLVNENGCDTSASVIIQYQSKPQIKLVGDTILCNGESFRLNAFYPNSTYLWQDGSNLSYFNVTIGGTYTVNVTNTCGDTSATSLVTIKSCACKFYIPSAFTPNGDGKNDVLKPEYECQFSNYEMKIYNRWGQLMFITKNPSEGWNGEYRNLDQPIGVYVYEITYKDTMAGEVVRKNGTIALIR